MIAAPFSYIGFDLSSTTTGWTYNGDDGVPIAWGQFTARKKKGMNKDTPQAERINHVCGEVYRKVLLLCEKYHPDTLVYEFTDWHQNLFLPRMKSSVKRTKYAIERRTQYALGQMAATMAVFTYVNDFNVASVGANEVKKFIGEQHKEMIAFWVSGAYPDLFKFTREKKGYYLRDTKNDILLSHHISDALAVGGYFQHLRAQEMLRQA